METSELLKKVRRIEIKTRGLSRNIFAGQYHSAFKGRGMAFSEVREYQYGDDIRDIDWNVTARYVRPYVKVFEEERELTVMLLIDVSGSRDFGSVNVMKKEVITEIAATLAFSAIQNNDKIGVVFFSDKIEKFIPPQKGKKHILYVIRELIDFQPDKKQTNIAQALKYLTNAIKKRCTAFLISDFIDKDGFKDALTGFYLKMGQTNLYAENLTYGYLEAISGNYDLYPNLNSWKDIYDYDNTWLSVKNNIYGAMYNVIANINNFLKYIDKNRSVVKTDKYYELMKGEALGLRAFLHFDLLRIFGPVYSENPTGKAIPYRVSFDQQATSVLSAEEVVTYVLKDLHEADSLLEVSDSKSFKIPNTYDKDYNAFESSRQMRMKKRSVMRWRSGSYPACSFRRPRASDLCPRGGGERLFQVARR